MSQYGFGDYLKEAFGWRWRVPLLGRMPLNAVGLGAFAVAGLANPGFWLLGIAVEVTYVMSLASSQRFQKLVQGQRILAQKETYEEKLARVYNRLSAQSKARYQRLYEARSRALGISDVMQEDNNLPGMRDLRSGGLNQLLTIFLRLLTSRELIDQTTTRIDPSKLEEEARQLEERIAKEAPDSPLRRALQGTHDIQRKRLENFERAGQSRILIDAELERIEQHVVLIGEEAVMSGNAEDLTDRLDSVTSALSETNRWLEQNAAIFGSLDNDPVLSSFDSDFSPMPEMAEMVPQLPPLPPQQAATPGRKPANPPRTR